MQHECNKTFLKHLKNSGETLSRNLEDICKLDRTDLMIALNIKV